MAYQPTNKNDNQRPANGSRCGSDGSPLPKRLNVDHLEPGIYEGRVAKCIKNLEYLRKLHRIWDAQEIELLVSYFENRLSFYQSKIDTAHAWLLDVESPQTL